MRTSPLNLILLTVLAAATGASAVSAARPPGNVNGSYNAIVAGDFTGGGTVAVGGTNLSINLKVKNAAGTEGRLRAKVELKNNRFFGTGTVMGAAMQIEGRLDPSDQTGEQLRGARIVATFADDQNHRGRLTGSPKLAGRGGGGGGGGDDDDDDD